MNTSKDKIDGLFSKKLDNYEVKPRVEAWEKLESRMAQKRAKVLPIWSRLAVAASLAIIIFAGGLAYFKKESNTLLSKKIALNTAKMDGIKLKGNKLEKDNYIKEVSKATVVKYPQSARSYEPQQKLIFANNEISQKKQESIEKNDNKLVDMAAENIPVISTELALQNSKPNHIDSEKTGLSKPEDLTIVFTVANFEKENTFENQTENGLQKDKKPKYLPRLFRQLINAKNGDRVDWNDVGFKPAKILARAENKLKLTKDDIADSYQTVKNKTVF